MGLIVFFKAEKCAGKVHNGNSEGLGFDDPHCPAQPSQKIFLQNFFHSESKMVHFDYY